MSNHVTIADVREVMHMDIYLASPRGFCAGVDRAILIVEEALKKYGAPVYVRHEIVHNKHVVKDLTEKGAIFIEEVDEAPKGTAVIFSAHGVPRRVYQESRYRHLISIDATCPLVKKVHTSIARHHRRNMKIILIGHQGHPEVEGTLGQLQPGEVTLVSTPKDVEKLDFDQDIEIAYTTQTTLSISETRDVILALKKKYPHIEGPEKGDLCYATTNRQEAVSEMAGKVDILLIIGSSNSSNSNRLKELGEEKGVPSYLIDSKENINVNWLQNKKSVGISSGASAPDHLVMEVVEWIKENFPSSKTYEIKTKEENVKFSLPKELNHVAKA